MANPSIRLIQTGTYSLGSSSGTVTLGTTLLSTSRAFLVFNYYVDASSYVDHHVVSGTITNSTTLTFYCGSSGHTASIRWWVYEFYDGVSVQHSYTATSLPTTISINKVNLDNTFILATCSIAATPSQIWDSTSFTAKLNSDVQVGVTYDSAAAMEDLCVQVISWEGAKVQRISDSIGAATTKDITINYVDLKHTLLFGTKYWTTSINMYNMSTAYLQNNTTVRLEKSNAADTDNWELFVVEIPEMWVQTGAASMTGASTTSAVKTIWTSHACIYPGPIGISNCRTNNNTTVSQGNYGYIRATIDSATQISFNRTTGTGTVYMPWQLFEYKEKLRIRKIQTGTRTGAINSSVNITIDPVVNINKCLCLVTHNGKNPFLEFRRFGQTAYLTSTTNLRIANGLGNSDTSLYVSWWVIEFETGVNIQLIDTNTNTSRPGNFTIRSVDQTRSIALWQMAGDDGGGGWNDTTVQSVRITSATNVEIDNQSNAAFGGGTKGYAYVLEFHDGSVQELTTAFTGTSSNTTMTLSDPTQTILFGSYQTNAAGNVNNASHKVWSITGETTITGRSGGSIQQNPYLYKVLIRGPSNITVEDGITSFGASATASGTLTKIRKYDRAFPIIKGINYTQGISNAVSGDLEESSAAVVLASGNNTINFQRYSSSSDSEAMYWSVVEVDPDPIYTRRRKCKLTIQASELTYGTVSGFPVMLQYSGSDAGLCNLPNEMFVGSGFYSSQSDGGDVLVTLDESGTTPLPLEIVDWHVGPGSGEGYAEAWVNIPSMPSGTNTDFWIWYNAAGYCKQPSPWMTNGSYAVWPTGTYAFVAHMSNYRVAVGEVMDSTAYQADITNIESATFNTRYDSTEGGKSIWQTYTGGSNAYMGFGTESQWDLNSYPSYQIFAEFVPNADAGGNCMGIDGDFFDASEGSGQVDFIRETSTNNAIVRYANSASGTSSVALANDTWPANWNMFYQFGYNGGSGFIARWNESRTHSAAFTRRPSVSDQRSFRLFNSKSNGTKFDGAITEFQMLKTDKGHAWGATLHNNLVNPNYFIVPSTPTGAFLTVSGPYGTNPVLEGMISNWDSSVSGFITMSGANLVDWKDIGQGGYDAWSYPGTSSGFNWYSNTVKNLPTVSGFVSAVMRANKVSLPRTVIYVVREFVFSSYNAVISTYADTPAGGTTIWHRGQSGYINSWQYDGTFDGVRLGQVYLSSSAINMNTAGNDSLGLMPSASVGIVTYDIIDDAYNSYIDQLGQDRQFNDRGFTGFICEVITYDRQLSSTERGYVETYLTNKWIGTAAPSGSKVPVFYFHYKQQRG